MPFNNDIPAEQISDATAGDQQALSSIVEHLNSPVYNLALRMLKNRRDAEDMTQEILVKVITRLNQFRGESKFYTWVFRIATNHLLNEKRKRYRQDVDFDTLTDQLTLSLKLYEASPAESLPEEILIEEVRRTCTLGMLQCLSESQRMVLILGEIYQVSSEEGAFIMQVTPATFRKRLSRARAEIVGFVGHACGIVNDNSPCACHKHVQNKISVGQINPSQPRFALEEDDSSQAELVAAQRQALSQHARTAALLRAHPQYQSPGEYSLKLKELLSR